MTIRFALFALLTVACAGVMGRGGQKSPLETLTDAENAFARMALEKNTREAFLTYMAGDGMLFRPAAVNAREWILGNAQWGLKGLLTWYPSVAGVSAAGDLGYTTGPWEFRPERSLDARPVAHGYFVSVWRMQSDGTWRNEVDLGTSNNAPGRPDPPFDAARAAAPSGKGEAADVAAAKAAVAARDAKLVESVAAEGVKAYERFLDADARVHREGRVPAAGRSAAAVAKTEDGATTYVPGASGVAKSGDLGYVYGTYERAGKEKGSFLRIWRKSAGGDWLLVLDVQTPG
jgi:ketosteroid isomerase-like protein